MPSSPSGKDVARAKTKTTTISGALPTLAFPVAAAADPITQLSSLIDSRSSYAAVAKSCLALNQFAGAEPTVTQDASAAKVTSTILSALMECVQSHQDRTCRILASKTLALVARSAFARIRHSPLLFSIRDGTLHRLEDEVGTDVPVALCSAALDDADDGVSAFAIEALGMLSMSSSAMVGTLVDDELLRNVEAIAHARPSPYAPNLACLGDEDPSIPQMELQSRIYENVLSPRLWRLLRRILHYESTTHVQRTLPFLTACCVHLVKLTPSTTFGMDRPTFAKRWIEVDALGLVYDVVTSLLLPAMQSSNDGGLAHAAVLSVLRLISVCPHASWAPEACKWSVVVLTEQLSAMEVLEHKMAVIATLLVALRGVPLRGRVSTLEVVVNEVRFLPSTSMAPSDITCAGFQLNGLYRRPARVGFLAEVALSLFLDGPAEQPRSRALKELFHSHEVSAIFSSRSGKKRRKAPRVKSSSQSIASSSSHDLSEGGIRAPGGSTPVEEFTATHVGEEFVLAFCQTAATVGEKVLSSHKLTPIVVEWLQCSMLVLLNCSACVNWSSRVLSGSVAEEDGDSRTLFSMLTTAQLWYIRLMHQCFYVTGMLSPASSISLHLLPLATPSHLLLLEEMASANASLAKYRPIDGTDFSFKEMTSLVDQFLEYKFREGVPSRHIRISLLSLLSDHWVESVVSDKNKSGGMDEMNGRELLTMLSEEISQLTTDLNELTGSSTILLSYMDVCVAAVENLALTAGALARRVGKSRSDIAEDCKHIVTAALKALEGRRDLRSSDGPDDDPSSPVGAPSTMLPVCAEAAQRIETSSGHRTEGAPLSLLVTTAARNFSLRISSRNVNDVSDLQFAEVLQSPFVLTEEIIDAPLVVSDAHIHAYFAQYCQQIVASRAEIAIQSSPVADILVASSGSRLLRSRNFLRLSAPPSAEADLLGTRGESNGAVETLSGGSDPVTFVLGYSMRRCPRYDCEPQYRLLVTMRIHNITAVEITKGVRMDLRVIHQRSAFSVAEDEEEELLSSASAVYKEEIKPGDHVTWEVAVQDWPPTGTIELHPAVTFREMENDHTAPRLNTQKGVGGDDKDKKKKANDSNDEEEEDAEDDHTDSSTAEGISLEGTVVDEEDEAAEMTLTGQPVVLSPMVGMQPCPLVFFRDGPGTLSVFRFLWYQMPHRLPEMVLFPMTSGNNAGSRKDDYASSIAKISTLPVTEVIDTGGVATKGWAFMTLSGHRLLCIMIQPFQGPKTEDQTERRSCLLYFRSDNEALLFSLMGSDLARNSVVSALTEGLWTCDTF